MYKTTLICPRPAGPVVLTIHEDRLVDGEVIIVREGRGIFAPPSTKLTVNKPLDVVVGDLTAWCKGELIQSALADWPPQEREWLITGIEPGHELNPY